MLIERATYTSKRLSAPEERRRPYRICVSLLPETEVTINE